MSKNIFIYEPYGTGHHTGFLRILLTEFARHNDWHTTLLTTGEARGHPSFAHLVAEFTSKLDVVVAPSASPPSLIRTLAGSYYAEQHANFGALRRAFRKLSAARRFDFALLPYMEAVGVHNLALRSVFGRTPWSAVAFGLRFHFREAGIAAPPRSIDALQRMCFLRMLKSPALVGIFSLDPYVARWANHPKVIHVPDPSSPPPSLDSRECRRLLNLPDDARIVLVYGAIDGRKCLDLLLPAIAACDPELNVSMVIAGIQDRRLQKALLRAQPATQLRRESRLFEFDHFIASDEEQLLFAAADIVWTYYADSYGSSGVLVKAGQYSKPVIVNDCGLVGKIVSDERCGLLVSGPDPAAVTRAIAQLVTQPADAEEMGRRGFARFSGHTPDAFSGPICAAIERADRIVTGHRTG
jgi:glycosyltransferase involved in cell wall biosynthesis